MRYLVPSTQEKAFKLAICEYLKIDPERVSERVSWQTGEDDFARVDMTFYIPTDDLLFMFNNGRAPEEPDGQAPEEPNDDWDGDAPDWTLG